MKTRETAIARYTLRDDGIVVVHGLNPEVPRTRDAAVATLDVLAGLIGGKPRPTLWDQRTTPRLDPEVWIEVIGRVEELTVALAIVADEETGRQLGAYSDAIGTLLIPTRTFSAEAPAIAWLSQFLD